MARKPNKLTPCCTPSEGGRYYRILQPYRSPVTSTKYEVGKVYPEDVALVVAARIGVAELVKENDV